MIKFVMADRMDLKLMISLSVAWMILLSISCCVGFPSQYRPAVQYAYNYYPSSGYSEDEDLIGDYNNNINSNSFSSHNNNNNQNNLYNTNWDFAKEPQIPEAYDQILPEDYYMTNNNENDLESQWEEVEALSNLLDMYEAANAQEEETPTWGHIVNEEPAEQELEELKHKKKLGVGSDQQQQQHNSHKIAQPVVKFAEPSSSTSKVTPKPLASPPVTAKNGQKEIPLLRPPVAKPKQQQQTQVQTAPATNPNEPVPVLSQRSDADKKPSPYDTLRKYISIEDALKKEAEKRRYEHEHKASQNHPGSRQKKSNFVADAESLTGQLSNLKKSVA